MLQCSRTEPKAENTRSRGMQWGVGLARETYIVDAMYVGGGSSLGRPGLDLRKDRASCN